MTTITIAHRFATIKNCDTIFVLNDGRITGVGTYDELAKRNESFQALSGSIPHI